MADTHRMRTAEARGAALARKSVPALITGGAGDDPAGVMTYTVIGATTGFSQLWLLVLSTPMLVAATSMAARVALATNNGLAAVIRKRYGRPVSVTIVLLLAVANTATIAADVAGVAVVLGMVFQVRWEFFVPLILLALTLVLHTGHRCGRHGAAGLGCGRARDPGAAGFPQLCLAGGGFGAIGNDHFPLYALLASQ
jgi:Mn2+/Fe2+ NRAMP family transporter